MHLLWIFLTASDPPAPVEPTPPVAPVPPAVPEPVPEPPVATPPRESVPQVAPTELRPKRRVTPAMPKGIKSATCDVKVWIDEEGKPYQVLPVACDDAVAQPAVDALEKWVWWPYRVDGEPRRVSTTITVVFKVH
jgi:Gram-negative bacterial TonB protein C-terminal